jgi:hypothetical protein
MKVGDLLLVTGPAFFEKTAVRERKNGIYTLENGIKIDRTLHPLNSKYQIEVFDEEKYKTITAQRTLTRGIDKLAAINKKGIENADIIRYAAVKISRILEKLGDI